MTIFTKPQRMALVLALVVSGLGLTACERKATAPAVLESTDSVLRFVPADTPYVLVNAEPIDDAVVRKMFGESNLLSKGYEIAIRDSFIRVAEEYPEGSEERDRAERAAAVLKDVLALFSLDGMRKAGFDTNESVALYGHGLLPVLRARLIDAEAFESAISEIESKAGYEFATAELDGWRYRYAAEDEGRIVIGAFDDYVVVTLLPSSFADDELRQLTGIELPPTNIASAGSLAAIAKEYGFTSHYIGFVDMRRIASTFVEAPRGLDALLLADQQDELDAISDVCRAEILEFTSAAPRAVFGYTRIAADGLNGSVTFELREDLAKGLMPVPAMVPGLGMDAGTLFSVGLGIDTRALRDFVEARLETLAANPWECEYFADLDASAQKARAALAQPIPPSAYGFKGVVAVFDNIDLAAMQGIPPTEADAAVLFSIEDAPSLLMTASMFSPELAALDIQPDGTPVALEVPQTAFLPEPPFVAMTENSLAFATGDGSRERIERLLSAKSADPAPFISFSGDAGRYYDMVGEAVGSAGDPSELSPEAREAMRDSMQALAAVYDRLQVDVRFTRRGITVDAGMTFKE